MEQYQLKPIGTVRNDESGTWIVLEPEYIPGLEALEGFSHINVIWWFSGHDREKDRSVLRTEKPYRDGPGVMGVFATRSPLRPNPIALTAAEIIHTDQEKGLIRVTFLDAYGVVSGRKVLRNRAVLTGGRFSIFHRRLYETAGLHG